MREILFRGKDWSRTVWIYGGIRRCGGCYEILPEKGPSNVAVYKDTIGQYTGLTDKNGKKIFEGDIVHMNNRKFGLSGRGVVVYRDGGFAIDDRKRNRLYLFTQNGQYNAGDYRVDGNIHDNPELMEGK